MFSKATKAVRGKCWSAGLTAAFTSTILQPASVFRYETTQASDDDELVKLTNLDLANALAFTLTNKPASDKLIKTFANSGDQAGDLLAKEATALLKTPDGKDQLLRFFREYFDYPKAKGVFKDKKKGHNHQPAALVRDMDVLVREVLAKDQQVFRTLLTTNDFYLAPFKPKEDSDTVKSYSLPIDLKRNEIRNGKPVPTKVTFPKDQRMGVLTHPAWLVAHSGNFDNDPIHRGLWIRKKLLGGMVPDVPINVDAKLPEEPEWTLRKRMHVTEKDECFKCHSKMNPLGLVFERYDHYGRFRLAELKKPVNTSGMIFNSGAPELDGPVGDPFELIEKVAASERVEQVFVRHAFRFLMGRNETLGDAKTLQNAHKAYVDGNGSMQALVISLLSSDSFIYRAKTPEQQAALP